jgi:hypothetical protein
MKIQIVIIWLGTALGVAAAPLGIMVPAYFYPNGNDYWNAMSNAATLVPLIAILNPASGPGTAQDANYVSAVANLHHAGGQVIAYVHTSYATRAMSEVTNDVSLAISRNAGWVLFTDADLPNPYDMLPTYWTNEVNVVPSLNQSAPVTRIKMSSITNQIPTLNITGAAGAYEIQSTSNLVSWTPLQVLYTPTGTGTVGDVTATNRAASFYRTRQ